jgi:hypothetical protein
MKQYRFEIVRRAFGRFGWIFVRTDEGERCVLARSARSYGSRERVRQAIAALEDAPIVDATKGPRRFPLPVRSFKFVPGVVPLIVDESPVEEHEVVFEVSAEEAEENDDQGEAAAAAQEEEAVGAGGATSKTRAARPRPTRRKARPTRRKAR